MTGRVAAVLAAGVSSLFATAALAGPGYGAYPPPGAGFPPPGYEQPQFPEPDYTPPPSPGYAPLPPEAYGPAGQALDDRPWPPAYAPGPHAPSYYRAGGAEGEGCGPCGGHRRPPTPPPLPHYPSCPIHCESTSIELNEEVAPAMSDAFFWGGMSGGAGPGLEIGGPAGGGAFGYATGFSGAFAHSYAYAYASASAHAKTHGHGGKPPCGCGGKGK